MPVARIIRGGGAFHNPIVKPVSAWPGRDFRVAVGAECVGKIGTEPDLLPAIGIIRGRVSGLLACVLGSFEVGQRDYCRRGRWSSKSLRSVGEAYATGMGQRRILFAKEHPLDEWPVPDEFGCRERLRGYFGSGHCPRDSFPVPRSYSRTGRSGFPVLFRGDCRQRDTQKEYMIAAAGKHRHTLPACCRSLGMGIRPCNPEAERRGIEIRDKRVPID